MPADGASGRLARIVFVVDDAERAMGLTWGDRRRLLAGRGSVVFDQYNRLDGTTAGGATALVHHVTSIPRRSRAAAQGIDRRHIIQRLGLGHPAGAGLAADEPAELLGLHLVVVDRRDGD